MEITDVKVFPVREEKLRAFVSIVLDRCFMINDIKIIQGREGLFISMPSRRKKNGEFKDVAHPLNNDTRRWLEEIILHAYSEKSSRAQDHPQSVALDTPAPSPRDRSRARISPGNGKIPTSELSLDEIQERHLSDSFWTVS